MSVICIGTIICILKAYCLNIFCLFVILSLTQLYRYTPEIFLFSTATFKYKYRDPLRRIGQEYSAKVAFSIFQSLKRIQKCFKNQMSVIWSWTYFYNLHWNNYLYFKGLLYIWEEMIMMALLHMDIVTLPRYFFFRLSHLNINTGLTSDELDKNIQRKSHFLFFSHWNRRGHIFVEWNKCLCVNLSLYWKFVPYI
jgi:hypothetical protein